MNSAYPSLLSRVEEALCSQLGLPPSQAIEEARFRAGQLVDRVLDPSLKAFVNALEWSAAGVYFLAVAGSVASVALIWLIPVAALALIGRRFIWSRR